MEVIRNFPREWSIMPEFTWDEPNIRPKPGAVWMHRDSWVDMPPVARTDVPKRIVRSAQREKDHVLISEYKAPPNVGDGFYKALRKLDYQKGPNGDYQ